MEVGIRELKAKLSEFVERASKGETIRVTARGRPRALLTPIPGAGGRPPALERGIREGWITARKRAPSPISRPRFKGRITVAEALAEDRGD
jgi:prevent-host-death family protein